MLSNTQLARSRRLRADRHSLEQLDAHLHVIQCEHNAALERAAGLAVELDLLRKQKIALASAVEETSDLFSREFFATCPEELLCQIFELLSNEPDKNWTTPCFASYNPERARLPFYLSGVCVRWRRVALALSKLWSYAGLPGLADGVEAEGKVDSLRTRVDLLLIRSRSAPLDVLVPWDDLTFSNRQPAGITRIRDPMATIMCKIFASLADHATRWRRVALWLPLAFDRTQVHLLRGPLPSLVELGVYPQSGDAWDNEPWDGCFPYAPQLKRLELGNVGTLCSPAAFLPSLTHLEFGRVPGCLPHTFVVRCASTVESLYVAGNGSDPSYGGLALPRLSTLHLGAVPYFASSQSASPLVTPCLTTLILRRNAIRSAMVPFLTNLSSTVTRLILKGKIAGRHLGTLSSLQSLTHFEMSNPAFEVSYTISNEFFVQLADGDLWPNLRSIILPKGGSLSYDNGGAAANHGNGLLRLVTSRNVPQEPSAEDVRPCRLETVRLEYDGVKTWLVAEIARLLDIEALKHFAT